jgi:hypothetical protein
LYHQVRRFTNCGLERQVSDDIRLSVLDQIEIPQPCPMPWRKMKGDARVRFCPQCQKNVYNLSAMSRAEAEQVLAEHQESLCAQIRRDRNGRVTHDANLWAHNRWRRWYAAAAALIASLVGCLSGCATGGLIAAPTGGKVTSPKDEIPPATGDPVQGPFVDHPLSGDGESSDLTKRTPKQPPFLWDGAETFGFNDP